MKQLSYSYDGIHNNLESDFLHSIAIKDSSSRSRKAPVLHEYGEVWSMKQLRCLLHTVYLLSRTLPTTTVAQKVFVYGDDYWYARRSLMVQHDHKACAVVSWWST